MYKILIVEDEDAIRRFIKINLSRQNWNVSEVANGEDAIKLVSDNDFDIILLDLMLPGIDGYEVCNKIRNMKKDVGIIMLTAKSQDIDKIMGLESGADDYITKPFNPTELILRIKSLARRLSIKDDKEILEDDTFKIDMNKREFYKNNEFIELTPTEFSIMHLFLSDREKVFTRDEILNKIWGSDFVGDSKIVDVNIRRIRSKIEEDAANPEYLKTIWGVGYRYR